MDGVSLEQLKAFVTAADAGSFSAAARELGKVQSVISAQVHNLELDLGFELFDRSGKYPKPTDSAMALLPLARQALAQVHRFQLAAGAYQKGEEKQLTVVCEELILPDRLNQLFSDFAEKFPFTQLNFSRGVGDEVVQKIASGEVDFGLIASCEGYPDEIDFSYLGRQQILTLVSPGHPLVGVKHPSIMELSKYRQLLTASALGNRRWQLSSQIWTCDSMLQVLALACEGLGWTCAPYGLADNYIAEGKLVALNIDDAVNTWTLGVELLWSSRTPKGLAGSWFNEQAKQLFA